MKTNNHPAHGPVSLDRLHQIREHLLHDTQYSNGGNRAYILADVLKVIDGAIAEFEEQDNPRPVMAVKGELGFIDNLGKIIEERDEDIDIGQLGRSNYDALMLAALDAFRSSLPAPVVPEPKSYMDFWEQYPDMTAQETIERSAGWNAYRAAMLQSGALTNEDTKFQATKFKPVADLYGITSPTGSETSFTFDAGEASSFAKGSWAVQEYVELERYQQAVAGNSPATPDGWVMVPKEMTDAIGEAIAMQANCCGGIALDIYDAMLAAAPQQ